MLLSRILVIFRLKNSSKEIERHHICRITKKGLRTHVYDQICMREARDTNRQTQYESMFARFALPSFLQHSNDKSSAATQLKHKLKIDPLNQVQTIFFVAVRFSFLTFEYEFN